MKVYNADAGASGHGMAQRNGTGIFPREVMNRFPLLPLEEEGRLNDLPLRENFIERVLPVEKHDRAYSGKPGFPLGSLPWANCTIAWTRMLKEEPTPGGLVPVPAVRAGKFHMAHKLTRETCTLSRAMAHGHWKAQWLGATPRWHGGAPGPPGRRRRQVGLGRTHRRVRGHAHGWAMRDGRAGQACERFSALYRLAEESPLWRGQCLPAVGWSSWASSRTTARGWCH